MIRRVVSQRHRGERCAACASRTGIDAGITCRRDGRYGLIDLLVQEVVSARMNSCRTNWGRAVVGSFRNLLSIVWLDGVIVDVLLARMVDRLDEARATN